jgi:hypothetical protein
MDTREEAIEELKLVFGMIADEYRDRGEGFRWIRPKSFMPRPTIPIYSFVGL